MFQTFGPLRGTVHECERPVATAVLLHGLGFGPWMWDRWLPLFAAEHVRTVALELPGHGPEGGNPSFNEAVDQVEAAVRTIDGPVVLIGHSMGGLIAQILATRLEDLRALLLICPLPAGQVRLLPARENLGAVLRLARPLLTGQAIRVPEAEYRRLSFSSLSEAEASALYARLVPWPNRLTRDLALHRPNVDPDAIHAPVMILLGRQDPIVPWQKSRVLGDLYEGVVWRYDDLAHSPPLEPGGERMGKDAAKFCVNPGRPRVLESEGFGPAEGVGHTLRKQRRGEAMKKRSAYGQKGSARS